MEDAIMENTTTGNCNNRKMIKPENAITNVKLQLACYGEFRKDKL
jgi:hypothetical protein